MVYTKIFLKFPHCFWPCGPGQEFFIYAHEQRGYFTFWQVDYLKIFLNIISLLISMHLFIQSTYVRNVAHALSTNLRINHLGGPFVYYHHCFNYLECLTSCMVHVACYIIITSCLLSTLQVAVCKSNCCFLVNQHMENAYPGSNILVVTLTNEQSKRVESQSDEETLKEAMSVLRDMFGPTIPYATDILVPRWWNNRFQRGSYSNYPMISDNQLQRNVKV